jgi:tRNA threonylcarbamoyladenosine biosynthesis protein TsaE
MTFLSTSPEETRRFGLALGRHLKKGHVVLFLANLGAGKTTLVQGLSAYFKVKDVPLSPTFVMAQTLIGTIPLHHLDFYRFTPKEILAMGIHDYLTGDGEIDKGVVLVEWAERCRKIWPPERLELSIKIKPRSTVREIKLKGVGRSYEKIVKQLEKEL